MTINIIDGDNTDNTLTGTDGADTINGLEGNDTINAGAGDDIVFIGSGVDTADGGANNDTLRISYATAGLTTGVTIDFRPMLGATPGTIKIGALTGNLTNFENIGLLEGGAGNDTFYLGDNFSLTTVRLLGGNDKYYGSSWADFVSGGSGDDALYGNADDDTLKGDGGNDILNGGTGYDGLYGGSGNDTYIVDSTHDYVSELSITDTDAGGTDTVRSSADFALTAFVEKLILTGTDDLTGEGNGIANTITGNDGLNALYGYGGNDNINGGKGDDYISGGSGSDILTGGLGNDSMYGGAGNDVYYVDSLQDYVSEYYGEGGDAGGTDTVRSAVSFELGSYVENLTLTGTLGNGGTGNGGANTIIGNGGANALYGMEGKDIISGGDGADTISGGAGADQLTGGGGRDAFFFDIMETSANRDTIKDFNVSFDAIAFDLAVFTELTADADGYLAAGQFAIGPAASNADHRLVYNTTNHVLYYDADGSGAGAQVAVAYIANSADLSLATILVQDSSLILV